MAAITHLNRIFTKRLLLNCLTKRRVATSPKKNETALPANVSKTTEPSEPKNWVSYGFETKSYTEDRLHMHYIFFASITLCLTIGSFYYLYLPDYQLKDWAQREAYLELRRREKLNLPLVDPNLIEPSKICLPTDEDLGNTEIII